MARKRAVFDKGSSYLLETIVMEHMALKHIATELYLLMGFEFEVLFANKYLPWRSSNGEQLCVDRLVGKSWRNLLQAGSHLEVNLFWGLTFCPTNL